MTTVHARTCHICEANCGILVEMNERQVVSIKGNPDHVLSEGYICPKATAIPDIQDDPDRLRRPQKKTENGWEEIDWDTAFLEIGERFAKIIRGPKVSALYLGNPGTHDYSKTTQIKNFIKATGVKGIYSASTLDQLPHMIAQKWVYGHNAMFPVADIDRTQYILIVGGNPLASNGSLWTVPNVRNRIKRMQERGGKLVVIDPRKTETAKIADEHHFIRPGSDTAFFLGLLLSLDKANLVSPNHLANMLDDGWLKAWEEIRKFDLDGLSYHCGISVEAMNNIAAEIGSGKPSIVYGRMGVSVQTFGTVNQWLIQLLNIATGNLDREGGVLFGKPAIDPVANAGTGSYGRYSTRLHNSPEVLGELPTVELADEIAIEGEGQIGALITVAGNPVISAPGGQQLDIALKSLDLLVSIDMYVTETSRHADYILPPCGPLENDHYPLLLAPMAVRNFAAYSPAVFERSEDERKDWEIIAGLTAAINQARGKDTPTTVHPHIALDAMLKASSYELTFNKLKENPNGIDLGPLFPQLPERLCTPDKKIHCAPAECLKDLERFKEELANTEFPEITLIGRRHIRSNNSWLHNSRRLIKGPDRCTLMMHPTDAQRYEIQSGEVVEVKNHVGKVEITVEITEDVMQGVVSIPHGYGHNRKGTKLSIASERPGVSINDLTDPADKDPLSGNAVLNGVSVQIAKLTKAQPAEIG